MLGSVPQIVILLFFKKKTQPTHLSVEYFLKVIKAFLGERIIDNSFGQEIIVDYHTNTSIL